MIPNRIVSIDLESSLGCRIIYLMLFHVLKVGKRVGLALPCSGASAGWFMMVFLRNGRVQSSPGSFPGYFNVVYYRLSYAVSKNMEIIIIIMLEEGVGTSATMQWGSKFHEITVFLAILDTACNVIGFVNMGFVTADDGFNFVTVFSVTEKDVSYQKLSRRVRGGFLLPENDVPNIWIR